MLHFVLFVPSANHTPLHILDNEGRSLAPLFPSSQALHLICHTGKPSDSNAFILPQWGGIVIVNRPLPHLSSAALKRPFETFRAQLLALLGVPELPPADIKSDHPESFSDWQLDALIRQRTGENVKDSQETLESIVKLVNQIQNMPVGKDVKGDVQSALDALERVRIVNALVVTSTLIVLNFRHSGVRSWAFFRCPRTPVFRRGVETIFKGLLQP